MGKMRIPAANKNGPTEINLTAMMLETIRLVTKTAVMAGSQPWLGISFYPSGCRTDMLLETKSCFSKWAI